MTVAKLSRLRHELPFNDQKKVRIVFVNVDPKVSITDLKKYISFFEPKDATDFGIVGLTGAHDDLQKVAKQYGATFFENTQIGFKNTQANAEPTQKADAIIHTDRIFLIDTTQTIRKIYPKEVAAKEVIEDIQTLLHTHSGDAP